MWRDRVKIFHWILLASAALATAVWVACDGALRWVLLSFLCTVSGLWIGLGVSFPHLRMFGRSLCAFQTSRNAVALTFDDGPDPMTTPAVLDILAERSARATPIAVAIRLPLTRTGRSYPVGGPRGQTQMWGDGVDDPIAIGPLHAPQARRTVSRG